MGWNLKHRPIRVTNGPGGGATMANLANGALAGVGAGDKVASVSYGGANSEIVQTTGTEIKALGKEKSFFSICEKLYCPVEV